ncbi:MAG: amidophosphoribosyltransferase [Planctomycetes bacterium]|nr:amidophosphoribosyltransferase [Planctomycetota bacterium]
MCGIVGLLLKKSELHKSMGEMVTPMLDCMGSRGPDSAGLAVFHERLPEALRRFSLFDADKKFDWASLLENFRLEVLADATMTAVQSHAAIVSMARPDKVRDWLNETHPSVKLLSVGRSIDLFKDEGHPRDIAARYQFPKLNATHAVGHTRMATESAVSPAHAHPFTAGEDFCLVHNGSLSNPYSIRRKLERQGIHFETDNDTEAGCRFIEWRMRSGDSLEQAIEKSFQELDGFFTFLMATADKMLLVRDAFACKPAVAAETDDYVAVASEFRSLAHLPNIQHAQVFEPMPEQIYSWNV